MLAVGTLEPRKNLDAAQQAARWLAVELRVVGARGWGGVQADGWLGRVSDDELAALYRGARCLVYPSLYEGFGMPIARGDGLRHAGRDERGRCDRGDGGRRRGARRSARPGGDRRRASRRRWHGATSCAARGLERARAFTWERRRRETAAVYSEAAA